MSTNQTGRKRVIGVLLVCLSLGMAYLLDVHMATGQEAGGAIIRGTVRSSTDGKPLQGILVKAKGDGKNYATSVFTDLNGNYNFPSLPSGRYQLSVGSQWKETVELGVSGARQDFSVQLGVGLINQTTAKDWADIVLANAKTDEEKTVLTGEETTCAGGCHTFWRIFNRAPKSAAGWSAIVNRMNSQDGQGRPRGVEEEYVGMKKSSAEVEKIANALGKSILPEFREKYASDLIVRPTDEAARAVFREWDLPERKYNAIGIATVDPEGIIWYVTSQSIIGRLDPRTNEFREWTYSEPEAGLHDVLPDGKGNIWITATSARSVVRFNTKNFGITTWRLPGRPHVGDIDSQGNFWVTSDRRKTGETGATGGIAKIDAQTGLVSEYVSPSKSPGPYGLSVDHQDNVWYTEQVANNVVKFEPRTGKFNIYPVPSPDALLRRIVPDSKGRMWFTQSNVPKLGMIDSATGKITEYDYGFTGKYTAYAYGIRVDKSDKVWVGLVNKNMWAKFDPETKKFVFFSLPSPEDWPRDAWFDYRTSPPSLVWGEFMRATIGRMYIGQ